MEDEKRDLTPEEQEQIDHLCSCFCEMTPAQRRDFMIYADGAVMAVNAMRRREVSA